MKNKLFFANEKINQSFEITVICIQICPEKNDKFTRIHIQTKEPSKSISE